MKRSLKVRLKSRRRMPSRERRRMWPPSRMGMGRRWRMPRLTLMSAIREITVKGPCETAFPAARGNSAHRLGLLQGDTAAEEVAENADGVFHDFPGAGAGFGEGLR